jgi:hypothetical protein
MYGIRINAPLFHDDFGLKASMTLPRHGCDNIFVKSGEVGRDQRKKLRVYSQNSRFSIFT